MNDHLYESGERVEENVLNDLFQLNTTFFRTVYRQLDVHLATMGVLRCDREDLIGAALVKAVVHRHDFVGGESERRIRCWLRKTVHRLALDWKRRLAKRPCKALHGAIEEPTDEGEAKRTAIAEMSEQVWMILEKVGPSNETSVRLLLGHFMQGYTVPELAEQFGMSVKSVECRIRRLVEKLRTSVEKVTNS